MEIAAGAESIVGSGCYYAKSDKKTRSGVKCFRFGVWGLGLGVWGVEVQGSNFGFGV